jgi:FtsH-binding integral membrane protein
MFIGHFGVGFAGKAAAKRVSLGTLFLSAQFLDLLWPTLLLLGIERVRIAPGATAVTPLVFEYYPFSHSLLAAFCWAIAFATIHFLLKRNRKAAIVLALLVISHWLLDFIVHRPDLPLYPGNSPKLGLDLWSSLPGTLAVELTLFAVGVWLYARTTRATDGIGKWGLWGLVVLLLVIYAGNLFGSPPPSATAIAWVGQLQWLLVLWGYWIDGHRAVPLQD